MRFIPIAPKCKPGDRVGDWLVVKLHDRAVSRWRWKCQCLRCKDFFIVWEMSLLSGKSSKCKSCAATQLVIDQKAKGMSMSRRKPATAKPKPHQPKTIKVKKNPFVQKPLYEPTPDEIDAKLLEIQSAWSPSDRERRTMLPTPETEVKSYHHSKNGALVPD